MKIKIEDRERKTNRAILKLETTSPTNYTTFEVGNYLKYGK